MAFSSCSHVVGGSRLLATIGETQLPTKRSVSVSTTTTTTRKRAFPLQLRSEGKEKVEAPKAFGVSRRDVMLSVPVGTLAALTLPIEPVEARVVNPEIRKKIFEKLEKISAIGKGDVVAVVKLQSAIKFKGGGHVNHSIFWKNLTPINQGGGQSPHSNLGRAIDTSLGSFDALVQKINTGGAALQGSGWVWLALDKELEKLVVETTANQ